jgi:uncharacterized membrane protein
MSFGKILSVIMLGSIIGWAIGTVWNTHDRLSIRRSEVRQLEQMQVRLDK